MIARAHPHTTSSKLNLFLWEFFPGFKSSAAYVNSHYTHLANNPRVADAGGILVHQDLLRSLRFNVMVYDGMNPNPPSWNSQRCHNWPTSPPLLGAAIGKDAGGELRIEGGRGRSH